MRALDTRLIDATSRRTRPAAVRSTAAASLLSLGLIIAGCAAASKGDTRNEFPPPPAGETTATRPAAPPRIDVDQSQNTGQVVTKADVESIIHAALTAQGLGNYSSEFGVGAALAVLLALLALWRAGAASMKTINRQVEITKALIDALIRILEMSSEREIKRIENRSSVP